MKFYVATLIMAMLTLGFKLKRCMPYAVQTKLFTDFFLNFVSASIYNHVHSCVMAMPVHAPHVDMMHVKHTAYFKNMCFELVYINAVWCFFKKKIYRPTKVL